MRPPNPILAAAWVFVTALCLSLFACGTIGLPTPSNTSETIAATIGSATAARDSATTLLAAKKITADDAENVQKQADALVAGAKIARAMLAGDPKAADAKMQATRAGLLALQAYLATKEKP